MMITNFVFDLGQVLLSFNPREYLEKRYTKPIHRELLFQAVFGSQSWLDLDKGMIDEQEAFHQMSDGLPSLCEDIQYLLDHWDEMLIPIEGTIALLHRLKEQNYRLFMISNFHRRAYDRVRRQHTFFEMFDGILISSHVKLLKPDSAIYERLLADYSLTAETCLFIDDTPANVAGAQSAGIAGLVFHDAPTLEKDLCAMGILKL
ncbi:MAG: HAD family phosphatase [Ruminiclostridium sp.]|nr:HAD family phosphatase [Ruminiclostridium sp.]